MIAPEGRGRAVRPSRPGIVGPAVARPQQDLPDLGLSRSTRSRHAVVAEESDRHEYKDNSERDAGNGHHPLPTGHPADVLTVQQVYRRVVDCNQSSTSQISNQSVKYSVFYYVYFCIYMYVCYHYVVNNDEYIQTSVSETIRETRASPTPNCIRKKTGDRRRDRRTDKQDSITA